jgi:16S rRNA (uracil1498-N3)-methyltransferase
MHRFFVEPASLSNGATSLSLPEKLAHQVRDVLRLAVGEQLVLLDNSGDEILCAITQTGRVGVTVEVVERRASMREPRVRVILCQGLLKSARFEWILEKGTELGVTTFAPILCRRSMSGLQDAGQTKVQRWQRIVQEAAEQCGRARVPTLLPIRPFAQALKDIPPGSHAFMPWEEARDITLRETLQRSIKHTEKHDEPPTVVLFIGPEGGLTVEEVQMAQNSDVHVVTLGARILRAETAALTTVANVMYELER